MVINGNGVIWSSNDEYEKYILFTEMQDKKK